MVISGTTRNSFTCRVLRLHRLRRSRPHVALTSSISTDDLRRLPDEKTFATTQWRGLIVEEPAAQYTTHVTRRALDRTTFTLRMEAWRPTGGRLFGADVDTPWQPATGDIRCTVLGPAKELLCGDRLEFAAPLASPPTPLCPGELDVRTYYALQGIYYVATLSPLNWRRTETGGGDWWQNLSFRARDWAYARLQIGLEDDPRMADFLAGMLIGYRQEIPTDIEQDFRRTGTLHVFAVSGQNIAEMVVVALILLQLCGLVRWRWAFLIAPIVLLYCLLTGSPASAVRATFMALAILLAWRLGRPLNALGCWSLAFLAMLHLESRRPARSRCATLLRHCSWPHPSRAAHHPLSRQALPARSVFTRLTAHEHATIRKAILVDRRRPARHRHRRDPRHRTDHRD